MKRKIEKPESQEEVFHQGASVNDEETLPWTMNTSQTLCNQGFVLLYKHWGYPMPNTSLISTHNADV